MILGQDKLLNILNSFTLDSFPKTSMIIGPYGSGKHLISKYISDMLGLQMINITKTINIDLINEIYLSTIPKIYIIESFVLKESEQNMILKFLEEPLNNSFIIVLAENKESLLPTTVNRCIQFYIQPYTKEILSEFVRETDLLPTILDICKTPGEVKEMKGDNVSKILDLTLKIIESMKKANYANMLTIIDKIKFRQSKLKEKNSEESGDKFDLFILTRVLLRTLYSKILENTDRWYLVAYNLTSQLSKNLNESLINTGLDQKYIFLQYLINMWYKSREV